MEYKHFSHPHNVAIFEVQKGEVIHCSGCSLLCSGSVYVCWFCGFFLHHQCGNATRSIKHPSHPEHPLTLVPYPTYSAGVFSCNACGVAGSAFSYCCAQCDFDLHLNCASLPETVKHEAHSHALSLTYVLGNAETATHLCDICDKKIEHKHWTYCCETCNFAAHISCATSERLPRSDQTNNNLPQSVKSESQPESSSQAKDVSGTSQEPPQPQEPEDPALVAHRELLNLKLQLQMSEQFSKMMSSWNFSSFV